MLNPNLPRFLESCNQESMHCTEAINILYGLPIYLGVFALGSMFLLNITIEYGAKYDCGKYCESAFLP
jgi:hypothetical protein